ncbi:uncharacterized protein PG998_002929 [Apiospora kogelbergensis]|uniref:uncharacterized protein n=1 Tax=Apiospora kogelbergensis TaxID=1337665 RepID=UPI0031321DC7
MADSRVQRILVDAHQIRELSLPKGDFCIFFQVGSKSHWQLVQLSATFLKTHIRADEIGVYKSSALPCCQEELKDALVLDRINTFFNSHCTSGDWINAGPVSNWWQSRSEKRPLSCKKQQEDFLRSLLRGSLPPVTEIPAGSSVQDLRKDTAGATALRMFKRGAATLEQQTCGPLRIADALMATRSSYRAVQNLSKVETDLADLLSNSTHDRTRWTYDHLIRCIRKLRRDKERMERSEDPNGLRKRQEKSAIRMHMVIDELATEIGGLSLILLSAFSVVGYVWDGVGRVEDAETGLIVKEVCEGIFTHGFRTPADASLFNPAAAVSWLLQEDYKMTCDALNLGHLAKMNLDDAQIRFPELSVARVMEELPAKTERVTFSQSQSGNYWVLAKAESAPGPKTYPIDTALQSQCGSVLRKLGCLPDWLRLGSTDNDYNKYWLNWRFMSTPSILLA